MKKIIFLTVLLTVFFYQSCQKDFLDVDQRKEALADINDFNNNDGAESFVTAIYNKFLNWNMSSFSWIGMTSIATDDADKGSSPGDTGTDKNLMDNLTWNASSLSPEEVFYANYQGINRCNQALYYLPQLTNADESLRTRLMGEARFLRAFMYFNLVRLYGGVPLVDHAYDPSSADDVIMVKERKSVSEIYAFIESDLEYAIANLPEKSAYSSDEIGRASKGAALALMAKVALYQEKWSDVLTYANQITGYSLVSNYASIFKLSGENNVESIFEIQAYGGTPRAGIEGYSACQGARGSGGWGWGFNTPSESLLNAYEEGDLRRDATIIFKGTTLYDGRVVPTTVENERYNYKAYCEENSDDWQTGTNIRYLRYAEVILMKAEAQNELGQTPTAIGLLDQVRSRAGLSGTTATSQSAVRTAIWKERRVELAMEHDRWFDLIRTGQAAAAFAEDGKTFVTGKHELFPIPQKFINETGGECPQNPGY